MNSDEQRPFSELPAALVEEVLARTEQIGRDLLDSFHTLDAERDLRRGQLLERGLLRRDSELEYVPIPTSCGIDGSYAVERLLAIDLVSSAAVAVEGLTPPSEKRYWPE